MEKKEEIEPNHTKWKEKNSVKMNVRNEKKKKIKIHIYIIVALKRYVSAEYKIVKRS